MTFRCILDGIRLDENEGPSAQSTPVLHSAGVGAQDLASVAGLDPAEFSALHVLAAAAGRAPAPPSHDQGLVGCAADGPDGLLLVLVFQHTREQSMSLACPCHSDGHRSPEALLGASAQATDWDSGVVEPLAGPLVLLPLRELRCFGWETDGDLPKPRPAEHLFLWKEEEETEKEGEKEATAAEAVW